MATDRLKNLVSAARARLAGPQAELPDIDDATRATIATVKDFTMTSPERLFATCEAVRYVVKHNIPGAIVECGVWRGGSSMAMLRTLQEVGDESREAYLFDTYEGMSEPTEVDVTITGEDAAKGMAEQEREGSPLWAYAPFEDVQRNVGSVGYPAERVHFVRGMVEDTIPEQAPEQIALLRLDTDFYESTKHELDQPDPEAGALRRADHRRLRPLGRRPQSCRRMAGGLRPSGDVGAYGLHRPHRDRARIQQLAVPAHEIEHSSAEQREQHGDHRG